MFPGDKRPVRHLIPGLLAQLDAKKPPWTERGRSFAGCGRPNRADGLGESACGWDPRSLTASSPPASRALRCMSLRGASRASPPPQRGGTSWSAPRPLPSGLHPGPHGKGGPPGARAGGEVPARSVLRRGFTARWRRSSRPRRTAPSHRPECHRELAAWHRRLQVRGAAQRAEAEPPERLARAARG